MHLALNSLPLAEAPTSPLALHTRELAGALLADPRVERMSWISPLPLLDPPPLGVELVVTGGGLDPLGQLRFEQWSMAQQAGKTGAEILLSLGQHAPLRSPLPVVVGGAQPPAPARAGIIERLRRAAGAAGAVGAAVSFHWGDLPPGHGRSTGQAIPPWVGPALRPTEAAGDQATRAELRLADEYVLAHGIEPVDVEPLLAAWTWVDASIGDAYPLVLAGLSLPARRVAEKVRAELDLAGSVQVLEGPSWQDLPALYRGAAAFLHMGYTADGQELRWALATGTPIAAVSTPAVAAIVGDAGYLVEAGEARRLGAAALTLLVERAEVGRQLGQAGMMRASDYHRTDAIAALLDLLASAVG